MQYGELYYRNYYKEVHVKNRVYYEYHHLDGTQKVPADYKRQPPEYQNRLSAPCLGAQFRKGSRFIASSAF